MARHRAQRHDIGPKGISSGSDIPTVHTLDPRSRRPWHLVLRTTLPAGSLLVHTVRAKAYLGAAVHARRCARTTLPAESLLVHTVHRTGQSLPRPWSRCACTPILPLPCLTAQSCTGVSHLANEHECSKATLSIWAQLLQQTTTTVHRALRVNTGGLTWDHEG